MPPIVSNNFSVGEDEEKIESSKKREQWGENERGFVCFYGIPTIVG